MKQQIITFLSVIGFILLYASCFYLIFEGICIFTCYSMEGNVTWNKIVFACHFEDNTIITTRIISSSYNQECYKNGIMINCSEMLP